MESQTVKAIVAAVVGGLIALSGALITELFQRQRDAIAHARQLAENTCSLITI